MEIFIYNIEKKTIEMYFLKEAKLDIDGFLLEGKTFDNRLFTKKEMDADRINGIYYISSADILKISPGILFDAKKDYKKRKRL